MALLEPRLAILDETGLRPRHRRAAGRRRRVERLRRPDRAMLVITHPASSTPRPRPGPRAPARPDRPVPAAPSFAGMSSRRRYPEPSGRARERRPVAAGPARPRPSDGRTDRVRTGSTPTASRATVRGTWRYTAVDDIAAALGRRPARNRGAPSPCRRRRPRRRPRRTSRRVRQRRARRRPLRHRWPAPGVRFREWCTPHLRRRSPTASARSTSSRRPTRRRCSSTPGSGFDEPLHVVQLAVPGDGVSAVHPCTAVRAGPRSRAPSSGPPTSGSAATWSQRLDGSRPDTRRRHPPRTGRTSRTPLHVGRTCAEQAADSQCAPRRSWSARRSPAAPSRCASPSPGHASTSVACTADRASAPRQRRHRRPRRSARHEHPASAGGRHRRPRARSFTGHVIVRPGADGTDASQSNRNLVLRPTAQVDTRPWPRDPRRRRPLRPRRHGRPPRRRRPLLPPQPWHPSPRAAPCWSPPSSPSSHRRHHPPSLRELVAATFAGRLAGPAP